MDLRKLVVCLRGKATAWECAFVCSVAVLWPWEGLAQDSYPRVEVFGGYSYSRTYAGGTGWSNASGWATSLTRNFNKHFGLAADLAGQYGGNYGGFSSLQYMAGPRLAHRTERMTFFGHSLFGSRRLHGSEVSSETKFAMDLGVGVDVGLDRRTAYRLIQIDYVPARQFGGWKQNYQVWTGFVFRFGGGFRK